MKNQAQCSTDLKISIPRDRLEPRAWPRLNVEKIFQVKEKKDFPS